jgi:flagellum-specific peptidoglycan hydrolase FlgJ
VRAHNLFGVKADTRWMGETITLPTRECLRGVWCTVFAAFRKYPDWQASLQDHAEFLRSNRRYHLAFKPGATGEQFARAVAAAGYATDPAYADKLCSIIRRYKLADLDA